ncbi:MAG: pilus assembly protein [Alphaproteobacteria bacterium]|nr:pilus assembly protein [Alphaproteobacteria bacterium]
MFRRFSGVFGRFWCGTQGATAVEFALVALPFFLMMFGVVEAGRIVWTMAGVQYAVEETSRYAALNSDLDEATFQTYAATKLSGMMVTSDGLEISSDFYTANGVDFVEVGGVYPVSPILDIFPDGFGAFSFSASARKPVVD